MKSSLNSFVIGILLFFTLFLIAFTFQQNDIVASLAFDTLTFITLLFIMILAGILDGFNPCAFTTLLLWSGFLLNRFGSEIDSSATIEKRRRSMLGYAILYSLGIGVVYFIFGIGLLQLSELIQPQDIRILSKLFGLLVTLLGIIMLRDSMYSPSKWIVKMPEVLHPIYKKFSKPATRIAAFLSGIIVGLCSIPCSGAIYMAVLVILQPKSTIERTSVLFFYNVGFVFPVIMFAVILANKKMLQVVSKDFLISKKTLKRIIGIVTILMGLLAIYMS